jgi:hypothetical protein
MGCGCGGSARRAQAAPGVQAAPRSNSRISGRIALYTVLVGDEPIMATTSPVAARTEARRRQGSVKVSSIGFDDPIPDFSSPAPAGATAG